MERGAATGHERHSDDELASALEEEVARITSAIPIIAGPLAAPSVAPPMVGPAAVVQAVSPPVDEEPETSRPAETLQEPETSQESETWQEVEHEDDEDADWVGPPTVAISFDDLPVRRERTGPQPTFSAWVAAATGVIPVVNEQAAAEPAVPEAPEAPAVPPVQPPVVPPLRIAEVAEPPETVERAEPLDRVPEQLAPRDSQPVPLVAVVPGQEEPAATAATGPVPGPGRGPVEEPPPTPSALPTITSSARVDRDLADDADDVVLPASAPVASRRLGPDDRVLQRMRTRPAPLFVPEATDLEPSPLDRRVGRASRLFWLWFAGTSSLISVGVGATLFTLGLSLRQLLVATLFGVALSFLPLGLGTLAGKWSGQPTLVVSRATFGMLGNLLPTVLALVVKLFWGAVLLWLAGSAVGSLAVAEGLAEQPIAWTSAALFVAIAIAAVVAYFGYALVARVQLVLTIASGVVIAVMIAATWPQLDLGRALAVPDSFWTHLITGAVIVFSYLGLAWAMSSAEVARYQRPTSSGATGMLWATTGAAVPPFVLVSYGGLLAASNPELAASLARDPVGALASLGLPGWYPIPLLLAVGLSLVSALVLTIYSAGFTVDALGARFGRRWSTVLSAVGIALAGVLLVLTVQDLDGLVRGMPTSLAVPVAAWSGLFAGEMMLRTRRFHGPSLLTRGGVYPDWRWVNLGMLVAASVVGFGLVTSEVAWLAWEGYLWRLFGVDTSGGIGTTDLGVLVALALGLATPMAAGVRAVRRQERQFA